MWSHSRCLCIVFLLFSPRLHSWNCEIFKLRALCKLYNLIWCLEGKWVWERIPLWRAAYLYMARASEMSFWTSCENDSSWYNGQLSELIRISDNPILLLKLRYELHKYTWVDAWSKEGRLWMSKMSFSSDLSSNSHTHKHVHACVLAVRSAVGFQMLLSDSHSLWENYILFIIAVECNHREENMPGTINHSFHHNLF